MRVNNKDRSQYKFLVIWYCLNTTLNHACTHTRARMYLITVTRWKTYDRYTELLLEQLTFTRVTLAARLFLN